VSPRDIVPVAIVIALVVLIVVLIVVRDRRER
jgi:hypothetical protein